MKKKRSDNSLIKPLMILDNNEFLEMINQLLVLSVFKPLAGHLSHSSLRKHTDLRHNGLSQG